MCSYPNKQSLLVLFLFHSAVTILKNADSIKDFYIVDFVRCFLWHFFFPLVFSLDAACWWCRSCSSCLLKNQKNVALQQSTKISTLLIRVCVFTNHGFDVSHEYVIKSINRPIKMLWYRDIATLDIDRRN